jgi:2,3-bisphosphoglycerate-dependent phosphoglycerate mutase
MATTILLARHGETDWNRERRFQGHADTTLNAAGRAQARELAEALAREGLDAVYASDLRRAHETGEIVGELLRLPVIVDPDLREIDVGSWSGLTYEQIGERAWDGETYEAHAERMLRAIDRIVEQHPGGHVAVISHGGSVRRVYEAAQIADRPVPENCEIVTVRAEGTLLQLLD